MIVNLNQDFYLDYVIDPDIASGFGAFTKAIDGLGNLYLSDGTDCYKLDLLTQSMTEQTQLSGKTIDLIVESASGITFPTASYASAFWKIIELSSGYTSTIADPIFLNRITGFSYKDGLLWHSQGTGSASFDYLRYLDVASSTITSVNISSSVSTGVTGTYEGIVGITTKSNSNNILLIGASARYTGVASFSDYHLFEVTAAGSLVNQTRVNSIVFGVGSYTNTAVAGGVVFVSRLNNLFISRGDYTFISLNDICVVFDDDFNVANTFSLPCGSPTNSAGDLMFTDLPYIATYTDSGGSTDTVYLGFFSSPTNISLFASYSFTDHPYLIPIVDSFSKKAIFENYVFNLPDYSDIDHIINSQEPVGSDAASRVIIINEDAGSVAFDENVNAGNISNQVPANNSYIELSFIDADTYDLRCFES